MPTRAVRAAVEKLTWGVVIYAAIQHFQWGLALLFSGTKQNVTNATLLNHLPNVYLEGLLLVFVSALAVRGLGQRGRAEVWHLLPQQVILALSASSALAAILQQHFGDGVPRPWLFIWTDQNGYLVTYTLHTLIVLNLAVEAFHARRGSTP